MFDDPNKELRRLQEQLLEAEGVKIKKQPAQTETKKTPSGKKTKKDTPKKEKAKQPNAEKDVKRLGGLLIALLLELALMLTVVVIWLLWK